MTTTLTVHPTPTTDFVPRPRKLRARPAHGAYTLIDGALDLGLVTGDSLYAVADTDGRHHVTDIDELRSGTLARIIVRGGLCIHHAAEFIDQARDDLRLAGAVSVHEREGVVWSFWPDSLSAEDVAVAVARSAVEFGLANSVCQEQSRPQLIEALIHPGPPLPAIPFL